MRKTQDYYQLVGEIEDTTTCNAIRALEEMLCEDFNRLKTRISELETEMVGLDITDGRDRNSGNCNSGSRNIGNCNSGGRNIGNYNTGDRNIGNRNSGYGNSEDRNSGNYNSGDYNSGDRNSGDRNSGNYNSGCDNSGHFNSITPSEILVFNKICSREVWEKAIKPECIYIRLTEWVSFGDMSEEEKAQNRNAKTTGGYLKEYEYKEAWKASIEKATQDDLKLLINLPNFDKDVFFEITGVDIDSYIKR